MMRRTLLVLIVANAMALAGVAAMWFDLEGHVRNTSWVAPVALVPDLSDYKVAAFTEVQDPGHFVPTVERPLFAPDRRLPPPPPPPAAVVAPVVDSLADARLYGIVAGERGAVLIHAEGRMRRVQLTQKVGEWTLQSTEERSAVFEREGTTRTIKLEYASLKQASTPVAVVKNQPAPGVIPPPAEMLAMQRAEVDARERRLDELRQKIAAARAAQGK